MAASTPAEILWASAIGITASYLFELREKGRLQLVIKYPKENWRMFFFDYLVCGFVGLAVSFYMVEAKTIKEGFMTGVGWEAVLLVALNERSKVKRRRK